MIIERWLPYKQAVKRKVILKKTSPDPVVNKPRNVIIQWESPQVIIKQSVKHLGIIRADPVEYKQLYGDALVPSSELPQFVKDIKAPDGIVLAADYIYVSPEELEGDLNALDLIDMEKEGLSQYSSQLKNKINESKTASGKMNKNIIY